MLFQSIALLSTAAFAAAQGVTSQITPTGAAPAGCTGTTDGTFEITIYDVSGGSQKRDVVEKRAECGGEGTLILTLKNGILMDNKQRTGYIASNNQFQFDAPVQDGAIYTAGWSVCGNTSLALGPTTNFYRCLSGSFYNLYNTNDAKQCELVAIGAVPCGSGSLPSQSVAISASGGAAAPVTASSDGQPEPTGAASPVTQITDGQPQGASGAAPTPVTQITDGQPQAPSALATAPMVSQITDGQIQVPTMSAVPAPPPVVSQITDGQPQAPTGTGAPIPSTPAAANGTISAPSPPIATGAASFTTFSGLVAAVAGVVAVAML